MKARIFSALVPGTIVLSRRRDARAFEPGDAVRIEHVSGIQRAPTAIVREVDRDEGVVLLVEPVRAEPGDWLVGEGEKS